MSRPGAKLRLAVSGRLADADAQAFPEDSGGPELAVLRAVDRREQTQLSTAAQLRYAHSNRTTVNLEAGFARHEEDSASPGIVPGVRDGVPASTSSSDLERTTLGANLALAATPLADVVVGVDFEKERGDLQGSLELFPGFELPTDFELEREILGVFGELRLGRDQGPSLSASLRHDDPDGHDAETTARIGIQYSLPAARLFASWSEGYKQPSFFALGHALVGNPDLRPETSTTWEVGVTRSFGADRLDLTLVGFRSEYEDLIDFDPALFTNVNRNQVDTNGFELAGTARPSDTLALQAHLSYVDIDLDEAGATLRQRPDWRGGVSAVWDVTPTVAVAAEWLYVGEVYDTAVPTGGRTLDGYHRVDLEVSWHAVSRLRLWLAVDNVLDESYEEAIGFPGLGLRGRVGVRYHL